MADVPDAGAPPGCVDDRVMLAPGFDVAGDGDRAIAGGYLDVGVTGQQPLSDQGFLD
jgi:hypothetical protein